MIARIINFNGTVTLKIKRFNVCFDIFHDSGATFGLSLHRDRVVRLPLSQNHSGIDRFPEQPNVPGCVSPSSPQQG
jgi:hypothetical protein